MRFILFALLFALSLSILPLSAQTFWVTTRTESSRVRINMRKEHTKTSESLDLGNGSEIHSESILSEVDHRPYTNRYKKYHLQFDQSYGPRLSSTERKSLTTRRIELALQEYRDKSPKIIDRTYDTYKNRKSRTAETLTFSFIDPIFGKQISKIRVMHEGRSAITQHAIFPENELTDSNNALFFESLSFQNALLQPDFPIVETWALYQSPHNVFNVRVPPKSKIYRPDDVSINTSDNASSGRYRFYDPVRFQNLFYNLYEYIYDGELTFERVEKIIEAQHIVRYGRKAGAVTLQKRIHDNRPYLHAKYTIPTPKGAPYVEAVILKIFFDKHVIFVQEILGSQTLLNTPFANTLLEYYEFHPERVVLKQDLEHAQ